MKDGRVDYLNVIASTRKKNSELIANCLLSVDGKSESELRDAILKELNTNSTWFAGGWYDPPPGGVAVLWGQKPFYERLKFERLRAAEAWPSQETQYGPETVGIIYSSPVDRKTGMLGDIGFTLYRGTNTEVQHHTQTCLEAVLAVAAMAETGMKFCDLYAYAIQRFQQSNKKVIGWMTTNHDPLKVNIGHTIPGSLEDDFPRGSSLEVAKEAIRTKRIYINEIETFAIPPVCALTLEARLIDQNETLPNIFFHVIVMFSEGNKKILTDFETIFQTTGMTYML